jgi:hypothetical protein
MKSLRTLPYRAPDRLGADVGDNAGLLHASGLPLVTSCAVIAALIDQRTTRRENRPLTAATYLLLSTYRSAIHKAPRHIRNLDQLDMSPTDDRSNFRLPKFEKYY